MDRPLYSFETVWNASLQGYSDADGRARLSAIQHQAKLASIAYTNAAEIQNYSSLDPFGGISFGPDTAADLKSMYNAGLVDRVAGRKLYNQLKLSAKDGVCPMCGDRDVDTIDHHLPKGKYPVLSVAAHNLIPCCRDCNTVKSDTILSSNESVFLNPYFDRPNTGRWLIGKVIEGSIPATNFSVNRLVGWDRVLAARVENHFLRLKLSSYFARRAARHHSSKRRLYADLLTNIGPDSVRSHILADYESAADANLNGWESATYAAWADSDWYCEVGCALG